MFLKNSRLELPSDEMNGNVIDNPGPGDIEQHPLNSVVFKAGGACGLFEEANNFLFVFPISDWVSWLKLCLQG